MRRAPFHLPSSVSSGISRVEILTALGIIAVIAVIFIPACFFPRTDPRSQRADLTQTLANMQRLQQAAAKMVQDGATFTTNNTLAWPGDLKGSFKEWTTSLVENKYLTTAELARLLSSPGRALPADVIPFANNAPVLVYTVADASPADTVLLTTDNFINTQHGGLLDPTSTSHWGRDFAVVRKDGSGQIFPPSEAGKTNVVGGFTPLCH